MNIVGFRRKCSSTSFIVLIYGIISTIRVQNVDYPYSILHTHFNDYNNYYETRSTLEICIGTKHLSRSLGK